MADPNQLNPPDADGYWQPDVDLGGADTVQKTTYVRGSGTEPDRSSKGPIATMSSDAGPATLIAVLAAVAILAVIVYLIGLGG